MNPSQKLTATESDIVLTLVAFLSILHKLFHLSDVSIWHWPVKQNNVLRDEQIMQTDFTPESQHCLKLVIIYS